MNPSDERSPLQSHPPLMVFADDWGRHPSSSQHLIKELLVRREVIWVNTIGTRPPRLDWVTVRRGMEKLRHWLFSGRPSPVPHSDERPSSNPQPRALRVLNPRMWPSFRTSASRHLNRLLLTRALQPIASSCASPPVVISTLPLMADLVGRFPATRWVYYCVDDFSVWPGLDGSTMRKMELELVAKVDVAIAASEQLQSHLASLGKPAHLLTHGVDLDFWQAAPSTVSPPAWLEELNGAKEPFIVFWGVIDRRLDLEFIRRLGESLERGILLLVGPQDNPDPVLFQLSRVRIAPALPYQQLPALARQAAVFIAPYADLPVTRAMQPLKLKEYLATGKPVVIRKLPATESWGDCADVCADAATFAQAVQQRLASGVPPEQQQARTRLMSESWEAKAVLFERWSDGG